MTTSETGDRSAFTLLEILLALALIALLATVFIGGGAALLSDKRVSPDDQFWNACARARKNALEIGRDVILGFDGKALAFTLDDGGTPRPIPVTGVSDLTVDFLPADKDTTSGATLVGGTLVETGSIHSVTFYADGTCTPFRAQLRLNGGAHVLAVDPWTCAPVLNAADAKP